MTVVANIRPIKYQGMLAELYVEALIADETVADAVWALWDAGVITDDMAAWAWAILGSCRRVQSRYPGEETEE